MKNKTYIVIAKHITTDDVKAFIVIAKNEKSALTRIEALNHIPTSIDKLNRKAIQNFENATIILFGKMVIEFGS